MDLAVLINLESETAKTANHTKSPDGIHVHVHGNGRSTELNPNANHHEISKNRVFILTNVTPGDEVTITFKDIERSEIIPADSEYIMVNI